MSVGLGLALVAGLLPASPAVAAEIAVQVTSWNVDHGSGFVTYDVTVNGSCDVPSCYWELHGRYADGTVDQLQIGIASGSSSGSSASPVPFSKRVTGTLSGSNAREITHLKATVTNSTGALVGASGLTRVTDPYPGPTVTLTVAKWHANHGSGLVDYDVTMNAGGLGQRGGPCDGVRCAWGIEAYYKDGGVQRAQHVLYSSSNSGGTMWTTTQRVTKFGYPAQEVTHLRAYVKPYDCTAPCLHETVEMWSAVSPPYPGPSVSLQVDRWQVDPATGLVDYDLTMKGTGLGQIGGPCDGERCAYGIEAYLINGSTHQLQHVLYSSSNSGGTTWTVTRRETRTGFRPLPVTHLRAYVRPYDCSSPCPNTSTESGFIPVATASAGGLGLVVKEWTADVETGGAAYNVEVSLTEDAAAPICGSGCAVSVAAFYRNSVVEKAQGVLGVRDLVGPVHIWGTRLTGSISGEITHLKASVTPAGTGHPSAVEWTQVQAPYRAGWADVTVNLWDRQGDTAGVRFDLTVAVTGASQVHGPCEEQGCVWTVHGQREDGTTTNLASGQLPAGTWTLTRAVSGTATGGITHVRATVDSICSLNTQPLCRYPWETYASEPIAVSQLMINDVDAGPLLGFLVGRSVTLDELCVTTEERARALRIPDGTPSTTTHAATEACLAASNVSTALTAIGGVLGGGAVIGAIISHYTRDDPDADPIAKVPAPETDTAGSGVRPPANCLDAADRVALLDSLPAQDHHILTNKHSKWTPLFEELLTEHFPGRTLNESWNIIKGLRHQGRHMAASHYWVFRNVEKALRESNGDWATFMSFFRMWVRDVIVADPTIVRRGYWDC